MSVSGCSSSKGAGGTAGGTAGASAGATGGKSAESAGKGASGTTSDKGTEASKGATGSKDATASKDAAATASKDATSVSDAKSAAECTSKTTDAAATEAADEAKSAAAKSEIANEMAEEQDAKVKAEAQRVCSADTTQDSVHTVQKGDTLSAIAKKNDVTVEAIAKANPSITDVDKIQPGDKVTVPGAKDAKPADVDPSKIKDLDKYPPGSDEQIALFKEAAKVAGVPESWASSKSLEKLLAAESDGVVGVPNYTYGKRAKDPAQWDSIHDELKAGKITAKSSATGLGQLLASNVDKYYPSGRKGIGDPLEEAAGMLSYIKDRYGSPDKAWSQYNKNHEGY